MELAELRVQLPYQFVPSFWSPSSPSPLLRACNVSLIMHDYIAQIATKMWFFCRHPLETECTRIGITAEIVRRYHFSAFRGRSKCVLVFCRAIYTGSQKPADHVNEVGYQHLSTGASWRVQPNIMQIRMSAINPLLRVLPGAPQRGLRVRWSIHSTCHVKPVLNEHRAQNSSSQTSYP